MRRSLTGTTAMRVCPRERGLPAARRRVSRWLPLFFLAGLLAPGDLRAQNLPAPSAATTPAAGPNAAPLSRFVPKENLICYLEFAGVDAHPESWKNTAAYKMLNETPLGEMLEEVAGQLLDKVLTFFPNHKLKRRRDRDPGQERSPLRLGPGDQRQSQRP